MSKSAEYRVFSLGCGGLSTVISAKRSERTKYRVAFPSIFCVPIFVGSASKNSAVLRAHRSPPVLGVGYMLDGRIVAILRE
jgi:hypothetical protein